ncbi:hypothetical protein J2Y66_003793 [Paenarthrobacter nitroguajacolicus]|nr:hypothetical protein [Paenarthrobacter nitroguajacolicus]
MGDTETATVPLPRKWDASLEMLTVGTKGLASAEWDVDS